MNHNWSGWPGAYCLNCGVKDWMEYAIGNSWYYVYTQKWKSEKHKKLVELINSECFKEMEEEKYEKIIKEIRQLRKELDE